MLCGIVINKHNFPISAYSVNVINLAIVINYIIVIDVHIYFYQYKWSTSERVNDQIRIWHV